MIDRRERFEEIYNAYSGLILAYAARRTADVNEAADVVADTFMVAWRRMDAVPAGDDARPWLYGVARNVLSNHRRSTTRRRRLDDRLTADFSDQRVSQESPDHGPGIDEIAAALASLSDADRELLTLVAWDGLGRDEIATMLGCRSATVRVRLHRARQRFEEQLNAQSLKRTTSSGHESDRWATARPDPEEA